MVGAGGKRWEFKLKAAEANGGQRTRMAAEASGGCQMNGGWQKQMVDGRSKWWTAEANGVCWSKWWAAEVNGGQRT